MDIAANWEMNTLMAHDRNAANPSSTFLQLFIRKQTVHFCFDKEVQRKLHNGDFQWSINA